MLPLHGAQPNVPANSKRPLWEGQQNPVRKGLTRMRPAHWHSSIPSNPRSYPTLNRSVYAESFCLPGTSPSPTDMAVNKKDEFPALVDIIIKSGKTKADQEVYNFR